MTNLESDMTFPTYGGEVKPATGATLFALGSWLRRGKASADARQLFLEGGRDGDSFYRDRWSYDKIRALHPWRELHGLVLVEDLRQGRRHHLGNPAD